MLKLTEFLRARLDEDEQDARTASHVLRNGAHWSLDDWHGREQPHSLIAQGTADQPVALGHFTADPVPTEQAAHIARHDPARVLAEVAAKRKLVAAYESAVTAYGAAEVGTPVSERMGGSVNSLRYALQLSVLSYADHPGFKEEWRP